MQNIMKQIILTTTLFALTACSAQMKHARTVSVHVNGDCGMCETRIEKAALVKGEAEADWDVDTKTARITYDSTRTTLDAVLQRIAQAGYDSEKYLAPDAAYAALPGCCQYERTDKHASVATGAADAHGGHTHTEGDAHAHHEAAATEVAGTHQGHSEQAAPLADEPLAAVYMHYFALKDALVASNAKVAMKKAGDLDGALHSVDPEKLPEAARAVWTEVMQGVMPHLHPLSESGELEQQRTLFAELTAPMARLAKAAPQASAIFVDHCPMYNGGADWLSQEQGIKNPFYGSMMLTCGSVKETIGGR